jgi:hypothetical protein
VTEGIAVIPLWEQVRGRLGRRREPLPGPAVHARTADDCRRDVTAPTLGNGVEACGVAPRCRGGHSAYRGRLASHAKTTGRSKQGFAAAASGHSLQHVLDNGRSLAAPNLIVRRAFGASTPVCIRTTNGSAVMSGRKRDLTPCLCNVLGLACLSLVLCSASVSRGRHARCRDGETPKSGERPHWKGPRRCGMQAAE